MTALLCVLAAVCEGIDLQAAGVAAAGIAAEFKPQPAQLGTFFSASTFGLLLGALLGGWLSDRHGRKSILVISVAAFGAFSILTAYSHDITQLTWARLFTGFGLGGTLPNLLALVTELSPEQSKRANLTIVYAAMPLGGALVSLLAMLVPPSGWRCSPARRWGAQRPSTPSRRCWCASCTAWICSRPATLPTWCGSARCSARRWRRRISCAG